MDNWIIDYHHAWLLRLLGIVLLCSVPLLCGAFSRRISQGIPICRHSKP
jgi:hypothetical protein